MAALNFPDPNVQTSYTNPDTGITYEWSNGIWKAVRTAQTAPELFVDVDGDNLTGNLTLGTDKIVLDATTGAATFDGSVESKNNFFVNAVDGDDQVCFRTIRNGVQTALINGNGSATFAGPITLGTWANTSDSAIYMVNQADSGQITVKGNGSSLQSAFSVYSGGWSGSSNQVATIKADGSATFGQFNSASDNGYGVDIDITANAGRVIAQTTSTASGVTDLFSIYRGTTKTFHVLADGSATFAGTVQVGDYTDGGNNGLLLFANGSAAYNNDVVIGGTGASRNIQLKADGTAQFAGYGQFGSSTYGYRGIVALNNDASGTIYSQNHHSGGAVFEGASTAGASTSHIYENGSASFGQGLTSGSGVNLYPVGQQSIRRDTDGNAIEILSGGGVSGNITASIRNDGSVWLARGNFQMDTAGVIQTNLYSSGTLNIDSSGSFTSPKIVLNAASGSASFAGYLNVNNYAMFNRIVNDGYANYFIASFTDSIGSKAYIKGNGIFIGNGLTDANGVTPVNTAIALRTDGSASFTGTITAGNVSDIKFKENIEAAPAQLADIEAFELKTFDWKDEAPLSDELKAQRKVGLIAQEVEAICPEMVYEVTGQDDDSYKAINHDVLIMKLLGAVKELSAKVEALEAK